MVHRTALRCAAKAEPDRSCGAERSRCTVLLSVPNNSAIALGALEWQRCRAGRTRSTRRPVGGWSSACACTMQPRWHVRMTPGMPDPCIEQHQGSVALIDGTDWKGSSGCLTWLRALTWSSAASQSKHAAWPSRSCGRSHGTPEPVCHYSVYLSVICHLTCHACLVSCHLVLGLLLLAVCICDYVLLRSMTRHLLLLRAPIAQ